MKNSSNKKISLMISSIALCATPFAFSQLTGCSNSNTIQFANFESYIDGKLMNHLTNSYDVQFQWFTVSEMIETKFRDTYDIAVPCGYELSKLYQKGWLDKIQWKNFNIPNIENAHDARSLFSDDAIQAIDEMNSMLHTYHQIPADFDILEYGIPYFAQSFVFMYKGEELTFYSAIGEHDIVAEPTWADIFYTISPQCIYGNRFGGKVGMLDDAKSLYDMARIVETIEQNPTPISSDFNEWTNSMPDNASINDLKNTFKSLTSKAQNNWYRLSTDSGQIARMLADHSQHGYNGALSWSGDALYASQGAGEYEPYSGTQMHTIKPKGVSLDEIDFIVINNKNQNNINKLQRIYKTIFDICFDSYNVASSEELLSTVDGRYKYWSMQNWDTVNYTPLLKNIYDEVVNPNSLYWNDYEDIETKKLMTSLITFPQKFGLKSRFGRPLTALQNSNTHWAWLETRGKL